MPKQFKDYPEDLQRIVELTPEGWSGNADSVNISSNGTLWWYVGEGTYGHTRAEYEKCRAAYLHETAGDVVETDWRGLCEELVAVCEAYEKVLKETPCDPDIYDSQIKAHNDLDKIRPFLVMDKARAALEASK